ncbi:hypothetical protein B0H11DRAFT_1914797 [Mycena galericulata]|nr:hypothetical protein B0H11DRAFT_1914797 [Mycena galericulata]
MPRPLLKPFYELLTSVNALLADVGRIESTRMAWLNVDETEIYDVLRGNMALLIFESLVGIERARRLRKFFPSIRELSQSLAVVRDTKTVWTTCNSNELSAFIFEILSQTLALPMIGNIETQYQTAPVSNGLILDEDEICRLTVKKIHEQLDVHRTLWRAGMTVIPRSYRLKNKAAKLRALRIAIAEHLKSRRQGSDMDGSDTLGAESRRNSAQRLDVMGFDEIESEKAVVGMGLGRLIAES